MTAEFCYTNQLSFREVDRRRCVTVANGGQMIAGTVATAMIVPVLRNAKQIIEMQITDYAERV